MLQLAVLATARLLGAATNIVHDCDEVYNYWEPLHYLLHGFGMQTWEYSSQFALRSYLYVLLHAAVAGPASLLLGGGTRKFFVFYAVRAALSLLCAGLEWRLVRASRRFLGRAGAWALTLLLAGSTGCFLAPATLLPSTFAMMCMASAATGVLNGNKTEVILAAAVAVTLGWPVAGVALLPFALSVLLSRGLLASVAQLTAALAVLLAAICACDAFFYGRLTLSLWNFVRYNVAGGGDSALYGVEPPHFYLANGLLNFNSALLLALALPLVAALQACGALSRPLRWRVLLAASPLPVWLAAISALPHKEERFLYVVYPQVALAAAATLVEVPRLFSDLPRLVVSLAAQRRDQLRRAGVAAAVLVLAQTLLTSASRSVALLTYYRAPLTVWRALSAHQAACPVSALRPALVCTGAEWYRFPSSFFLPSPQHRLAFVDSAFDGLLPKAYSAAAGGTRAAPPELNGRNRKSAALVLTDASACAFLVGLPAPGQRVTGDVEDAGVWRLLREATFVDHSRSRFPWRSFWLPGAAARNTWGRYQLWRNEGLLGPCPDVLRPAL